MRKRNQDGFVIMELLLIITVVGLIIGAFIYAKHQHQSAKSGQAGNTASQALSDGQLPLKSIGFNLDFYDPATNHAGDMVFTHVDHDLSSQANEIFADFGTQDPRSPNDPNKRNPQPTFILPLGTKVHSLVDGVVVDIKVLYSSDQTIWVAASDKSHYVYETEHVVNPVVKKGDKVKGGQVIGEVSNHNSDHHPGFGIVEIGILYTGKNQPQHLCPFHYLDPSIKTEIGKKILNIHQAWSKYVNMPTLYDDAHSAEPGCFSLAPVNG